MRSQLYGSCRSTVLEQTMVLRGSLTKSLTGGHEEVCEPNYTYVALASPEPSANGHLISGVRHTEATGYPYVGRGFCRRFVEVRRLDGLPADSTARRD